MAKKQYIPLEVCGPSLTAKETSSACVVDAPVVAHLSLLVRGQTRVSPLLLLISGS